jgi:hypothetical protein
MSPPEITSARCSSPFWKNGGSIRAAGLDQVDLPEEQDESPFILTNGSFQIAQKQNH